MCKWLMLILIATLSGSLLAEPAANNDVRDPTIPLGYVSSLKVAASAPEWVLDSVLISPKRKLAIINGQTLREGQTLPGSSTTESNAIKIQRILPQTVVLQQGEKTWALRLSPSVVKRH